jgi:uncharacterized protein (TIGR02145 family)
MKLRAWLAQWVALLPAAVVMGGGWLSGCEAQEKSGSKSEKTSIYFTDSRNGQKYRAVKVGGKTWMAENLKYQTENSWCYENDNSNCNKYGRLYTWNAAKGACPTGWRLPSRADWDRLGQAVGGAREPDGDGTIDWKGAGKKLKASSGWNEDGNGTDDYGFSALPGGLRLSDGDFGSAGNDGNWWAATERDASGAYYRAMNYYGDYVYENAGNGEYSFSVRCVRD